MKLTKVLDDYLGLIAQKKSLEAEIEVARNILMDNMHKHKLTQLKTKDATLSLAVRENKRVNELEFRRWASENPNIDVDLFYDHVLNTARVAELGEKVLEEDGEIVPFVSVTESEYISVRPAKK